MECRTAQIIKNGGIVAFATDTLFALACDATNTETIVRLFDIKQRPIEKTAPLLVSDIQMAMRCVYFSKNATNLATKHWPGALTMILPSKPDYISRVAVRDGTLGVRQPNNAAAIEIIQEAGVPLIGTSANIAGGENLMDLESIQKVFGKDVFIIDTGHIPNGTPSTIVDMCGDSMRIIRQGAIFLDEDQ